MSLLSFFKTEFKNFGKYEKFIFPAVIIFITAVSLYLKDNKIALVSAICGVSYTILAGKGKISCYIIGMVGTVCYSYLALINGFYGNLLLYSLYYFPMEIIGIYKWKKHLKKEVREIIKTHLTTKERIIYIFLAFIIIICFSFILKMTGAKSPYIDSTTTILSVFGQLLTVKRCIEQWYVWFFVNLLSALMWINAYINGSDCFATILMWLTYLALSIYFLKNWKKEISG